MASPKRYAVTDTKTGKRVPSVSPKASMGDLQTVRNKTLSGGSGSTPPSKGVSTGSSGSKDVAVRGSRSVATSNPSSSATRTMKDVQGERIGPKRLSGPSKVADVAEKAGKLGALGRLATGVGMYAYSKDAGEGSDFKGTDKRPDAWSGFKKDSSTSTTPSPAAKTTTPSPAAKTTTPSPAAKTTTPSPAAKTTARAPVESSSSRASRQAAYDDWVKSNRDPMSQLAKDRGVLNSSNTPSDSPVKPDGMRKGGKVTCMKSGGVVKSSASSRGDGCAQRGKTRGKWV